MSTGIARRIDEVLPPLGFKRQEATWTRRGSELIDLLDLQIAKYDSTVTANLGVLLPEAYEIVYERKVPDHPSPMHATVERRLGHLIGTRDRWWSLDDPLVADELAAVIASHASDYFAGLSTPKQLEDALAGSRLARLLRFPQAVYVAYFMYRRGDVAGACELLTRYERKNSMFEVEDQVRRLRRRFGCPEDGDRELGRE